MNVSNSSSQSLQQLVVELYKTYNGSAGDNRALEAKIKSMAKNVNPLAAPGTVYLDTSPTGAYVWIGDTVIISGEAYRALQKAHYEKIDGIIERGESLSAKGISFEEYRHYVRSRGGSDSDRFEYYFFCYDGKSRDYFEKQAMAVYDRWAAGEDIPEEELQSLTRYVGQYGHKAEYRRWLYDGGNAISAALEANGFKLGKDERIDLTLAQNGNYRVSGIDDPVKRGIVEDIVNRTLSPGLWGRYINLPGIYSNKEIRADYNRNCNALTTASAVRCAEKILKEYTDEITLKDLYLDSSGNIQGNLPKETLDILSEKETFQNSLSAIKRYGYENIPTTTFYFSYSNGELTIENPMVDLWTQVPLTSYT
jgi:hypothetical protein